MHEFWGRERVHKEYKKIVELRMRKNKIVHDTAIVKTLDLYNLLNVIKKYERR